MAQLSNCFCSIYQFLTLCRLLVASAALCRIPTSRNATQGCLQCHNPLFTFVYQLICQLFRGNKLPINYQAKVNKVWALPHSLATTNGIVVYFLFLALLRCFSSGGYLLPILYIQISVTRHDSSRVSPFGHLRIKTYLAVPRSFSQLIASFIGIVRQGILCVRLFNFLRI
jgi:hypothetical protein